MTIIGRDRRLLLLLGALAVALAGLVYAEIRARPVVESPRAVGSASDQSAIAVPARKPTSDETGFQAILERPLFSPTRRRHVEQSSFETAPVPDFALFGVTIAAGKPVALVKRGDGAEYERVSEGDQISGWTVGQITTDRISVQQGEVHAELHLDFAAPAPAAPATANAGDSAEEERSGELPEPEVQPQQGEAAQPEQNGGSEASVEESSGG